jgi:hypothetical protein
VSFSWLPYLTELSEVDKRGDSYDRLAIPILGRILYLVLGVIVDNFTI